MAGKKFFSLLHGGSVHIAPKKKVIPAEQIGTLVNAQEVLSKVQLDAEQYRREVVAEAENLKEQAERAGFEEGFKQWSDRVSALEEEIKKVRQDTEKQILPIALKAAKKIVSKELELSSEAIVAIVSSNIKAVSQHKRVTIYVNQQDLQALEAARPKLKELFESLEALSIRPRSDIQPGGCVIETEAGIINAQIDNRWRILEAAFETFLKGKV